MVTKLYTERRKISRRLKTKLKEYSATTDERERYVMTLCMAETKTIVDAERFYALMTIH